MKSKALARGLKKNAKGSQGFTLVELITVVAIISLLVVYITVEIGTTNDDAKVGISNTFFLGNVPAALGSYKSRHANSCSAWGGATPATPAQVKADLVARGLIETTPWQTPWTAAYVDSSRRLVITFPTAQSDSPGAAAVDIANSVVTKPQAYAVRVVASTATVATAGAASDRTGASRTLPANAGALAVVVDYDCI